MSGNSRAGSAVKGSRMEKITRSDKALHALRLTTILLLLIYGMMQKLSVFSFVCNNRKIPAVFLLLFFVVLLWDLFSKRRMFKGAYVWVLVGFLLTTVLSCLVNIRYGYAKNVIGLSYLVAELAVLYPFSGYRETAKRDFRIIAYVVIVFSLLLSLYTYVSYFLCLQYHIDAPIEGLIIEQGYWPSLGRAWGFYFETNWQGMLAVLTIFLSGYLFITTRKKAVRVLLVLSCVYHLGVLALSGSRSATLGFFAAAAVLGWYFAAGFARKHAAHGFRQQLVRIAAGLLTVLLSFGVIEGTKFLLPQAQVLLYNHTSVKTRLQAVEVLRPLYALNDKTITVLNPRKEDVDRNEQDILKPQPIERLDIADKEDKANGRTPFWKDAVTLIKRAPVFGISPQNVPTYVERNPEGLTSADRLQQGDSFRSGYLNFLVSGGIVNVAVMVLFLLLCVLRVWRYQRKPHKNRAPLGWLLGIPVSLLVFILFSTDLFYWRSILTYMFWIALGFGMYLIDEDMRDEGADNSVFVCDTPYQVMQAVNFVDHDLEKTRGKADLYIYAQFSSATTIAENLRGTDIFRGVYLFKPYAVHKGLRSKLATLFRQMAPTFTLSRHKCAAWAPKSYGTLYVSFYTSFTDSVRMLSPQATVMQLEDGIGSYYIPNLETQFRSGLYRVMNKVFFGDALSYHPQALYLNRPDCYTLGTLKTAALPPLDHSERMQQVFGYTENTLYAQCRRVYLTQPLAETAAGGDAAATERSILEKFGNDTVIRVHPRQDTQTYAAHTLDTYRNMWELECARQITDDHTLVGAFSTAQFIPKMLYDKEPTVIFLYKLFGNAFENADVMIDTLRGMYTHPEKIVVAESLEELDAFLQ